MGAPRDRLEREAAVRTYAPWAETGAGPRRPRSRVFASTTSGVWQRVGDHGLLIGICAMFVFLWTLALQLGPWADSWLTLLGGREILANGIPHHDTFAVMTSGREWVDQQWLAQVLVYGITAAVGIKGVLLTSLALFLIPLVLSLRLAVARGASARSIAPFAIVPAIYFGTFLRAQIFSQILFVVLLALLSAESRKPSRRALLAFPLLALWANLHGAVIVGAALTSFLGACELIARVRSPRDGGPAWTRSLLLVVGPWPCLFASPYGLALADYYHSTLANPVFRQFLSEWMAPTFPSIFGFGFFVLAGGAIAVVARRARDLTPFEHAALAFTLVGGLLAARSIPWFAYSALVLLPPVFERCLREPASAGGSSRLGAGFAAVTSVLAVITLGMTALRPEAALLTRWPDRAVAAVEDVLRQDGTARVLAAPDLGDWLLYASPSVRGRIAFDGRWELFSPAQARMVVSFLHETGENWEQPARGYRVLVLKAKPSHLADRYAARSGARVLYRDEYVVVVDRGRLAPT